MADLLPALPHAGGKAGQIRRAKSGGLPDGRAQHLLVQDVGLELHQEVVAAGTAVHLQGADGDVGVLLHGPHQVGALVGDGFFCRADDVVLGGAAGDAQNGTPGVHIPVGCAQTGKGGHDVHAAVVRHLLGVILGIAAVLNEVHPVPDPLDDRAAHKDRAFQRILHLAVKADGNGGDQTVLALVDLVASVHQQKAAGAVGVFYIAGLKAALPEQRGLLVARNTGHRHIHALNVGIAVHLAGVLHAGQDAAGNVQRLEQGVVPVQCADVVQHGAAGVGAVGNVHLAAGQLPDQPSVHRAEQKLPGLGLFPRAGDVVQDPLDLSGREIGVRHKAGVFPDIVCHAGGLEQLVHKGRGAAALPDDGIIHRASSALVPQDGGLALVGDADARNVLGVYAALGDDLVHYAVLAGPDLHRVVLHPALMGVDLLKFPLMDADDVLLVVKQDRPAAGSALIQ